MRKSKRGSVFIKVDFEKAYDNVDWGFLDFVICKMGFGERWRKWIISCISSATVSIMSNNFLTRQVKMRIRLRQGCPLSPFLFNLVAKAFSALMNKARDIGLCRGVVVGGNRLMISHLQYVDDTMIFSILNKDCVLNIKRVLRYFQVISSLKINFKKSNLYGIKVGSEVETWVSMIPCQVGSLLSTYLGLSFDAKHHSINIWSLVVERF